MQSHSLELKDYYNEELLVAFKAGGFAFAKASIVFLKSNPAARSRVLMLRALFDLRERSDFHQYDHKYRELLTALPENKKLLLTICQELQKQGYCTEGQYQAFAQVLDKQPKPRAKKVLKAIKKPAEIEITPGLLESLPTEVLSLIVDKLSKKDIGKLRQASKFFNENPEINDVQLRKRLAPFFACGEHRAYFLCDSGATLVSSAYQPAINYETIDIPDQVKLQQVSVGLINSYGVSNNGQLYFWRNQGMPGLRKNDGLMNLFELPRVIDVAQVAAGLFGAEPFIIIRSKQGHLYAQGSNKNGQLGVSASVEKDRIYTVNLPADVRVRDMAAGAFHALCCSRKGEVYEWGNKRSPHRVEMPLQGDIIRVSAGLLYSLALSVSGDVFTWNNDTKPAQVTLPPGTHIIQIEAGREYSLCLSDDGRVFVWKNDHLTAIPVTLPDNAKASQIATNGADSFITTPAGKVYRYTHPNRPELVTTLSVENETLKCQLSKR